MSTNTNNTSKKLQVFGLKGKSAYEYAKEGGYTGTEEEFRTKLAKEIPEKLTDLENDSNFISGDDSIAALIEADMLPAVTNTDGKILTDENGKIILRY